jgi:hypothetical protein
VVLDGLAVEFPVHNKGEVGDILQQDMVFHFQEREAL